MSGYTIGEILVWLLLAAGLGFVLGWLVRELQLRAGRASTSTPVAAPARVETPEPPTAPVKTDEADEPVEVDEPSAERRIKGKLRSKIYHAPDSPAYARTQADVWFATAEEAEEAGFRKPRNASGTPA